MLNKVLLIGRITKDIELKSNDKTNYVQNTLAVQRGYKNKNGEYVNCLKNSCMEYIAMLDMQTTHAFTLSMETAQEENMRQSLTLL